jgi:hypothetical protein
MNSDMARQYLFETVIPICIEHGFNEELANFGYAPFVHEQLMKFVNLKTLDIATALLWLCLLGLSYCENKKQ